MTLTPPPFSQSLLRAVECLENNEKVIIELSATGGLYELFEIVTLPHYKPVGLIRRYARPNDNYLTEHRLILEPSSVSCFFFQ